MSNVTSDIEFQNRSKLVECAREVLHKSVVDGLALAQLYFPDSKISWAKESNKQRQIMVIDGYKIVFQDGSFRIEGNK